MPARSATRLSAPPSGALYALPCGLVLACALGACGMATSAPGGVGGSDTGTGGNGGTGGTTSPSMLSIKAVSIEDETEIDSMRLKPLAEANIVVTVRPPPPGAERSVRFALLPAPDGSQPLDAVLTDTDVQLDGLSHNAIVKLTAPSTPTSFQVRASEPDLGSVVLDLAVVKDGTAMLLVKPSVATKRVPKTWVASAWPESDCTSLQGSPPPDGPTTAESHVTIDSNGKEVPPSFPLELEVPSDVPLAVLIRGDHVAWGCTPLTAAKEGPPTPVEVLLTNVPITLAGTKIEITLAPDDYAPLDAALGSYRQDLLDGVLGEASDDVEALLDAMQDLREAAGDSSFATKRTAETWEPNVRQALGATAETALRAPLDAWIGEALAGLPSTAGIVAELEGLADGSPAITLAEVFDLTLTRSTFELAGESSLTFDANDGLLLGASMTFDPRGFLLGAARQPAIDDVPAVSTLGDALASSVCATVTTTLIQHGDGAGHSSDDCDEACTSKTCTTAVKNLLGVAAGTGEERATFDIALTATAIVGDDAQLLGFAGGVWLASIEMGADPMDPAELPVSLTGQATTPAVEP